MTEPTVRVGIVLPQEAEAFIERHARFFQALPRLQSLLNRAFIRTFRPSSQAEGVIFVLGRMAVEDFMEILILAGNGYGIGAEKLLRGLFERVLTCKYLSHHTDEITLFLEYDYVNVHRLTYHAKAAGIDLSERFKPMELADAEKQYERVKANYPQNSWTKKDLATIAGELG